MVITLRASLRARLLARFALVPMSVRPILASEPLSARSRSGPYSGHAPWCNIVVGMSLADRRVRAVAPDDRVPHTYFVFADGQLLTVGSGSTQAHFLAGVPDIRDVGQGTGDGRLKGKELEIGLYVHGPWVCVTERFGVNASLINTATGAVRGLGRADYHSDVSSYSIGFLDRDGRTLLVAQTQ